MDDDKLEAIKVSLHLAELAEVNVMLTTPQLRMLIEEITRLRAELATMTAYADKLADGLPMLPKDVEVIRDANWQFAQENFDLKAEVKRLRDALEEMSRSAGGPGAEAQRRWWAAWRAKQEVKP